MSQYDQVVRQYDEWVENPLRKYVWREMIEKNLKNIQGKRVLDVACGTGYSMEILYKLGAKEVVGIDSSAESVRVAKEKFPQATFTIGDISKHLLKSWDNLTSLRLFIFLNMLPLNRI